MHVSLPILNTYIVLKDTTNNTIPYNTITLFYYPSFTVATSIHSQIYKDNNNYDKIYL